MDAPVVVDVPAARDVPVDRITVVDTGAPDLIVATPCTIANGNNNCPDGFYCQSANCMTGVCVAAPPSTEESPVCGCDRLTYWNTSIAAANGASVRATGTCANNIVCSANNPNTCPMPVDLQLGADHRRLQSGQPGRPLLGSARHLPAARRGDHGDHPPLQQQQRLRVALHADHERPDLLRRSHLPVVTSCASP